MYETGFFDKLILKWCEELIEQSLKKLFYPLKV